MSRFLRIEYENSFHHVIARGFLQKYIFLEDADFQKVLSLIEKASVKHRIIIHSYCIMNNHFHLLVQNPSMNLVKFMYSILMNYALYFNKKYKQRSKVFETKYLSPLVDTENYLLVLCCYIHLNPVNIMVQNMQDWKWSSYRFFIDSNLTKPSFLMTDLILKKLDYNIEHFKELHSKYKQWDPNELEFSRTIIGSEAFIEDITSKYIEPHCDIENIDSYKLNKSYRNKISQIQTFVTNLNIEMTVKKKLLIYGLATKTNLSYKEISQQYFFGLYKAKALCEQKRGIISLSQSNKEILNLLYKIDRL